MRKKKICITGASSGIGRATAVQLIDQGHEVLGIARREDRLVQMQKELGSRFLIHAADVSNAKALENVVATHKSFLDELDVLVNNAGLALGTEKLHEASAADVEQVLQTNVMSVLRWTQQLLPAMVRRKSGHVVMLGSVAGRKAYAGGTVYCASKAAVHMMTECLRMDLGGTGVRVSTIAPGRVAETEFSQVRYRGDEDRAKKVYEGYRVMTSEDVAKAIAWVIAQPEHVNIQELVLLPTDQPSATTLAPLNAGKFS